jgi:ubiquinone biosynthesis protein
VAGERDGTHDADEVPFEVRVRRACERLGPVAIKIGQMLSTRRDLIPPALAAELARLQDQVPFTDWEEMEQTLREELGGSPNELFAQFATTPMAAASIGQVYRARLHDGRRVAVKIQRPGTSEIFAMDLDILVSLARHAEQHSEWARVHHLAALADDMAQLLLGELDYGHEARSMRTFKDAFAGSDSYFFPAPIMERTSARVLTMELVEGIPASRPQELREAGVDVERMVQNGVDCYLRQIFGIGMYHADPHAGNLIALSDGRLGFVDFGRVGTISQIHRDAAFDMLLAFIEDDALDATEALMTMCAAEVTVDLAALQADIARVSALYKEGQHRRDLLQATLRAMLETVRQHGLQLPGSIVQLIATIGVLEGVASELQPGFSMVEALQPFAAELATQEWGPRTLIQDSTHALRRYRRLANELPVSMTRVLRRAAEGEFQIGVRPKGYESLLRGLREMVDRLCLAIIAGALVLGAAYVSVHAGAPEWVRWCAGCVLMVASLVVVARSLALDRKARRQR